MFGQILGMLGFGKEEVKAKPAQSDIFFSDVTIQAVVHESIARVEQAIKSSSAEDKRFVENLTKALKSAGEDLQAKTKGFQQAEAEKVMTSLLEGHVYEDKKPSTSVEWLQSFFFELTCLHAKEFVRPLYRCIEVVDKRLCCDSQCIDLIWGTSDKARKKRNNFDMQTFEYGIDSCLGSEGVLVDTSIFGSCKTGFCISEPGISSIESKSDKFQFRWYEVKTLYFNRSDNVLSVNGKKTGFVAGDNARRQLRLICEEFDKIKESSGHKLIRALGLDEGDFYKIVNEASPLAKQLYEAV
jgi:hypothetical protein